MSKELEAFNKIVSLKDELEDIVYELPSCFDTTELAGDEESIVEKGLKALDIIKKKGLYWDIQYEGENDYRAWDSELYKSVKLTKEEYDLLKEVLSRRS